MNVVIVGCGVIGQKRAAALGDCQLVACVDLVLEKAQALAKLFPGALAVTNWCDVIQRPEVEMVIISTMHAALAEIALAAVQAGKHVLIEKPAGRFSHELESVMAAAENSNALVRIGFNHRYHSAFRKARELVDEDALGELMFIRARYGHGGRIGYDKEWRAQPELSGGGELIDQGIHLIDLARWFLGDFNDVQGHAHTYFWDMRVEDNGFLLLKTARQQTAFLHASCTEWKNLFSFEIYGRKGKIDIQGLGGSYGTERLIFYKMLPSMGPPETFQWEYPLADNSWGLEISEFIDDIRLKRQPAASIQDAYSVLKIVEEIYRKSHYDYRP